MLKKIYKKYIEAIKSVDKAIEKLQTKTKN